MKNVILLICVLLFSIVISAKPKPQTEISYTIKPIFAENQLRLKISASFTTGNFRQTKIEIPKGYGGQQSFQKCISELKMTCPNCNLLETDKSYIKIIKHQPKQTVTFEYIFSNVSNLTQEENVDSDVLPQLKPTSFYFFGLSAWILPVFEKNGKDLTDYNAKVNLNWVDFPADWKLGNSFGFNQRKQTFTGGIDKFAQTGFAGGDYRFITFKVRQTPVTIAVFKDWEFKDEEIESALKKILNESGDFWQNFEFPHYFASLIPPYNPQEGISLSGTGGTYSIFLTATKITSMKWMNRLLAHEIFHNWNSVAMGRMVEPKPTWFSEGFTNYYTFVILLRAGLINLDEFIEENNLILKGYYVSKAKNMKLEEVREKFFSDGVVQRVPYQRGYLLALKWNAEIKEKSNGILSLRDLMLTMLKAGKQKPLKLQDKVIVGFVNHFTKRDVAKDVEDLWVKGESFELTEKMLPPNLEIRRDLVGSFDIGYDTEKSYKVMKITGLRQNTNAYKAGLREGMELIDYFYDSRNPQKTATIIIKENNQEKRFSYLPESDEKTEILQLRLKDNIAQEDKNIILRWFKEN